jgi:hypothetical protein
LKAVKAYLKTEEIVVEILYHLSLKVFGSDHAGKSAYIQLGMTSSEHMYVLSATQADQATDSTELEIEEDDLTDFRRRFKAARKKIRKQLLYGKWDGGEAHDDDQRRNRRKVMSQWRPSDFLSDANGKKLIVNKKKTIIASMRRYSEMCVQVIGSNGKGRMLRALLDSGG